MTAKAPSTDVDESKKKTDDKKEKEIQPEEPRGEVKGHKAFKEQEENFAKTFSNLTKEGVLETLQKKLPDNFKNAKSYEEAMEILKDGRGVERLGQNKDMYERLDLNVKKQEEKRKQEKEVEKKKEELKEDKKSDEKKTEKKSEGESYNKEDKKHNKNEKSDEKKEDKKEKSEKKGFFGTIKSFLKGTRKQAGNLINRPFRAIPVTISMTFRSLKQLRLQLDFPFGEAHMKKLGDKYKEDMKKYWEKLKWDYKKGGK